MLLLVTMGLTSFPRNSWPYIVGFKLDFYGFRNSFNQYLGLVLLLFAISMFLFQCSVTGDKPLYLTGPNKTHKMSSPQLFDIQEMISWDRLLGLGEESLTLHWDPKSSFSLMANAQQAFLVIFSSAPAALLLVVVSSFQRKYGFDLSRSPGEIVAGVWQGRKRHQQKIVLALVNSFSSWEGIKDFLGAELTSQFPHLGGGRNDFLMDC